jgi:UDP-N-acetylmuramoyl-tripeptide--D-alanyl-D-alanine ligase
MKSKKVKFLETILRFMAKAVLAKYEPTVIGITGSVGKTSAKESVFAVLNTHFSVRKNEKNYNNEIGIPLTVLGVETGGRSLFKWVAIGLRWIWMLIWKFRYPEILILELGVDRPGDMDYLLSFVKPHIGIVTNISSSHIEFFKSLDGIAKEKRKLIESLPADGFAILNADDERVFKMSEKTDAQPIFFGFSDNSDVKAVHGTYNYDDSDRPEGLSFKLNYDGKSLPIRLKGILAAHQINAALAGISAGISFKINLVDCAQGLEKLEVPLGRLNIIKGIRNSTIIDDSYNASPVSTIAALGVFEDLKANRKIAVLGDMLELGSETQHGHEEVAKRAVKAGAETIILVGQRMLFAYEVLKNHQNENRRVFHFHSPVEAGKKAQEIIREGDMVLVKGSQGMRMEKVLEMIIANPENSEKLICRQSQEWKKKPFIEP